MDNIIYMPNEKTNPNAVIEKKVRKSRKPKGVWAKIMAVQQSVQVVAKLGYNDYHKYKYAYERDYIAEIKPILGTHGLVITQSLSELIERDVTTAKGATENRATVKMLFSIVDTETSEQKDFVFPGSGQDAGDKAVPKALTMATKYFLGKIFLVESSDDAENEALSNAEKVTKMNLKKGIQPFEPGKPGQPKPVDFEKAKTLISNLGDKNKLFEVLEGIKASKLYTEEQKKEISLIISQKINEIDNQAT